MHKFTHIQLKKNPLSWKILHWRRGQRGRLLSAVSLDHWRLNEIHRSPVSTDGLNSKSIIWAAILKLLTFWFFTEFVDVLWNFSPFINIESFESCFLPPHSPRRSPSVSFHYIIHTQSKILSPSSETTFSRLRDNFVLTLGQLSYFRQKDTTKFTLQRI